MQDVAERGASRRRDDADPAWHARQRALAFDGEQPLGSQLHLEQLETLAQSAFASLFHEIRDELVVAALLVQAHATPHQHARAVPRREPRHEIALAEHGAAELGGFVLEREIPVARGGARQVRDLALQPQRRQAALQQRASLAVEARGGIDVAGFSRLRRRARLREIQLLVRGRHGKGGYRLPLFLYNGALSSITRVPSHAHSRGSTHLRRRAFGPGTLRFPAARRRPEHATHPHDPSQPADPVRCHGHGHRSPPGDHDRAGRRPRHRAQEHEHRGSGARGSAGQEVRKRRDPRADHDLARQDHPRSAGADALQEHFGRAGRRRRRGRSASSRTATCASRPSSTRRFPLS